MKKRSDLEQLCPKKITDCAVIEKAVELEKECQKLRELSQIDTLTGLYNFGFLVSTLEMEMERTRRSGLSTGLIMMDLDYFKNLNDTYGHETGNEALKWISEIMKKTIRKIDIPCRYGGEEFAIILPGIRLPQAIRAAERLRKDFAENPITINDKSIKITASFGVDAFTFNENLTGNEFIQRTDSYLLQAKELGRNMVCSIKTKGQEKTEITPEERAALTNVHS